MQKWYDDHRDNPYPSKDEKVELAQAEGKSVKQVDTWFKDERKKGPVEHR